MTPPIIRHIIDTPANAPITFGRTVDCLESAMAPETVEVLDGLDAVEVKLDVGKEAEGEEKESVVTGIGVFAVEDGRRGLKEVGVMLKVDCSEPSDKVVGANVTVQHCIDSTLREKIVKWKLGVKESVGVPEPWLEISAGGIEMASSLSPECTPLKLKYDACFNAWFEGYLEPITEGLNLDQKKERAAQKAKEYEDKCGHLWESYRTCLQSSLDEKGITELLRQSQKEDPLLDQPPLPPNMTERTN
ncbi:hypothetical protein Clacol_002712 [Clathrus columnatus]|uniref:Uncharacterized protein n=1 Tax=Clathrus columnatus TaxID=1419009 RepID=A0AAV5A5H0_9AGAM|nr:hypothetical protein Clacol_002712 [Clathrus columnatus]